MYRLQSKKQDARLFYEGNAMKIKIKRYGTNSMKMKMKIYLSTIYL